MIEISYKCNDCTICNFVEQYGVMGFDEYSEICTNKDSKHYNKTINEFMGKDCEVGETEYVITTFEEEYRYAVDNGYIDEDGTPLKCQYCDSTDLEDYDETYEEHHLIESACRCKSCGKRVGIWAYGYWQL